MGKVLARHVITRAAGSYLPLDQFIREVTAEVVRDLNKRTAKNIQAALAAADQLMAFTPPSGGGADRQLSAVQQLPVAGDPDLSQFHAEVAGWLQRRAAADVEAEPASEAVRAEGPPPWHPEHPSHE